MIRIYYIFIVYLQNVGVSLSRPKCSSLYNLFYAVDPLGFRLEPLLDDTFSTIDPLLIPCYLIYPTGQLIAIPTILPCTFSDTCTCTYVV